MTRSINQGARERRHLISPVLHLALLLGVLAHLSGFLLFRVISNPLPDRVVEPAFVSFIDADSLVDDVGLEEQATLFDSAPLFIPGRWSASSLETTGQDIGFGQVFPDFEPALDILGELKPGPISLFDGFEVKGPEDLLELRFWDLLQGFGQGEAEVVPFVDWEALAEVRVIGGPSEAPARAQSLTWNAGSLEALFVSERPVVFLLGMSAPGIAIGAPTLKQSSGVDEIDSAAREWLLNPATLSNLPEGFLEVRCFL